MAKKTSKKKATEGTDSLADSARGTAASILGEVEKAGEVILGEIKGGLGTVSDKLTHTAKSVAETRAAQLLKSLVDEVEEISGNLVSSVSSKLDSLRGKVEQTQVAEEPVKKKSVRRKKPASKKATAKKTTTRKTTSKKTVSKKATSAKKSATKKAPAKKATASKTTPKETASKKIGSRKTTAKKKPTAKKKTTTRKTSPPTT